ncbi:MAG: hypothetical protein AABX73_04065 [Nanoarchaeota archaeon]
MDLNELKETYGQFEKKYRLPSFGKANENFEIEKLDRDSDAFLRAVRKVMIDKVVNSFGFVEMLMNPINAPRMYFSYIHSMGLEDKKRLDFIYTKLAELSLASLELEIDYSEKGEAELIKNICSTWDEIKPVFREILKNIKKPDLNLVKKERNYFG